MTLHDLFLRARALVMRSRVEEELHDELDFHLEMQARKHIAAGLEPTEAARRARAEFGSVELAKEDARDQRRVRFFDELTQDVRYAARGLMRRPGFTAVAVATLAIGIGATTAIFSAVDTLILRPLPFTDPDRLMQVSLVTPATPKRPSNSNFIWSYRKFLFFRDQQQAFESITLTRVSPFNVTSDDPERIGGEEIDARYLPTLGAHVQLGTNFPLEEDAHPGSAALALISDGLWQRRYGADPGIIGKSIALDNQSYEIVGVTGAGFRGLSGQADVLIPITARTAADLTANAQQGRFTLVARRKPSVSREEAQHAVAVLGGHLSDAFPGTGVFPGTWGAIARDLDGTRLAPIVRQALFVLFGAVSLVLLIACVNLASLLLGRAHARRREIAVRLALGARRARLVRLLITETMLLAFLGGVASLLVAWGGALALARVSPSSVLGPASNNLGGVGATVGFSSIHLDATALAFALGVAIVVGLVFGLVPALQASNPTLVGALKEGVMTAGDARGRRGFSSRHLLVVSEVALALILLVSSGLMIRSLGNLLRIDPGFDARHVLTLQLAVPAPAYVRDSMPVFYTELTEKLSALPGVTDVSLGDCPPLASGCARGPIAFLDQPPLDDPSQNPSVGIHWVTPRWFSALRVPVLRGRSFTDADRMDAPKVVLMSETAARQFWPNENPIGKRVGVTQGGFDDAEVVGIVGDVRQRIDSLTEPVLYLPYAQSPHPSIIVFLRATGDPAALATVARTAIRDVAPAYPVFDVRPLTALVADSTVRARFSAVLLALFAGVALVLAVVGIYGVMALTVAQRTREIGIRMALGADRTNVLYLIVGQGIGLAAVGAALGLAGALTATRVLRSLLFGVETWDLATYGTILLILTAAAAFASWIPARRATRISPTEALRYE